MKSSTLLIALLLTWPAAAVAQDLTAKQSIVSLPEGGFVSFRNETAWTDLRHAFDMRKLPPGLGSQTQADRNQTIHRVLRDSEGKLVFGYDLWVSGDPATRQFKIAVKPLNAEIESAFRAVAPGGATENISTFPKSTELQTLNDGAEFSLDLLINQNTGVKIIDVLKVTFDRSRLGPEPGVRPRDFTVDAVELEMKDYSLMLNDSLLAMGKSKVGCTGTLLWLYIPNRGRFIFSLSPREGYPFEKVGTVASNKIEFTVGRDHFEWWSSSPILREEGTWNLWVLQDLRYTPMFAVREPPAADKNVFEKLDDAINKNLTAKPNTIAHKPAALTTSAEPKKTLTANTEPKPADPKSPNPRATVMMGGADRIENLLPRN